MKTKRRGEFEPRAIDRTVFAVLAFLIVLNGLYVAGPWYLHHWTGEAGQAPLLVLLDSTVAVKTYGALLIIDGLALLYASAGRGARRAYITIVSNALLAGFLLRLYSLIGVFFTLESWRPPSYLSHVATVAFFGAYWVWVKVNARPTE